METFNIIIFRQSRVLLALFLLPVALIGLTLLGLELGSILFGLVFFSLYLWACFYYTVGHLVITIADGELHFKWARKLMFNYSPIEDTKLTELKTIVIDKGQFLRKLMTADKTIYINTSKVKPQDSYKLIAFFQTFAKSNNVRVINTWGDWADKGYLKLAYQINIVVLVFAFVVIGFISWKNGFSPRLLFLLLLALPLLAYKKEMRQEMDVDKSE